MEFNPPVSERKTKDLFDIISNDVKWSKEIQLLAEEELSRRNFTQELNDKEKNNKISTLQKLKDRRSKTLEKNKTESYTATEMILILAFFPFSLIIHLNPFSEFWELEAGNYKKKIWQRIILILISIVLWIQIVGLIV
jgi:hypothetical protein